MPTNQRSIRWGILATGRIAEHFATDLALVDGSERRERSQAGCRAARGEAIPGTHH